MTLTKQMWIAITLVITLTFVSGFLVSSISARNYYQEQLRVKNIDNATAIALTLTPIEKDPITVELILASQFDTGHYSSIKLLDAEGEELVVKESEATEDIVPEWFKRIIGFDVPVGVAQVQDGWNQYGTVYVESQSDYALVALWRVFLWLFFWFSLIAVVSGVIGSVLMRLVNKPLGVVVAQAEAIGERRFIMSEEPKTTEFKRLVVAMNRLTERVRSMLEAEATKLSEVQKKTQLDEVTGVANRSYFMKLLSARLSRDEFCQDTLFILHIKELGQLNANLGRPQVDQYLKDLVGHITTYLNEDSKDFAGFYIGRLKGSDIAIMLTDAVNSEETLKRLQEYCLKQSPELVSSPVLFCGRYFVNGEQQSSLLSSIDQMIVDMEQERKTLNFSKQSTFNLLFKGSSDWYQAIQKAIVQHKISTQHYPVLMLNGETFHQEAMFRIELDGRQFPAGSVIGWAKRLGLLSAIDVRITELAIASIKAEKQPVAVNISLSTLLDGNSYSQIMQVLERTDAEICKLLSFEVDEYAALKEPALLASFTAMAKYFSVTVGLQEVSHHLINVKEVERLGLEYLKISAVLVNDIASEDSQLILRSICNLGSSLGSILIATGVNENTNISLLESLGFEAVTGPAVQKVLK